MSMLVFDGDCRLYSDSLIYSGGVRHRTYKLFALDRDAHVGFIGIVAPAQRFIRDQLQVQNRKDWCRTTLSCPPTEYCMVLLVDYDARKLLVWESPDDGTTDTTPEVMEFRTLVLGNSTFCAIANYQFQAGFGSTAHQPHRAVSAELHRIVDYVDRVTAESSVTPAINWLTDGELHPHVTVSRPVLTRESMGLPPLSPRN